jgi:hypothetical protein
MESNKAPFKQMFSSYGMFKSQANQKDNEMASWLDNTIRKNELLPPLPSEIWQHIITFVPCDPRTSSHKFELRKWLYKNEDGSIPVYPIPW